MIKNAFTFERIRREEIIPKDIPDLQMKLENAKNNIIEVNRKEIAIINDFMDKYFQQVSPTQKYFAGGFMMAVAGKAAIGITATAAGIYSLNKYFNGGQNKNFPSL